MRTKRSALLRACLLACVPFVAAAQTPLIVEAEDGVLGASLVINGPDASGVTYIETTENSAANPTPARTATFTVTFPAAGSYALYARILTGPVGGNDDSFYIGNGFNTTTGWSAAYNTSTGGATAPNAPVPVAGTAGQNVWKWVRLTSLPGSGGGLGPSAWVVPEGELTQTFAWGSREDGLLLDKFAFGPVSSCYRVGDLDNLGPPTATCPPPQPAPPAYTRVGEPLATGHPKFLGSAHSGGNASLNFGAYWNQVTPENGGKWGSAQPQSPFGPAEEGYPALPNPQFNFAGARAAYNQARANNQVFKWHVLFWGNQQPGWIENLPEEKKLEAIHIWLGAIAREFPDLEQIEVVNEPLHDPPNGPTNGNYYNALGGAGATGWDWIINAFTLARQYFPNAQLMLNDYSITNDGNATTRYLEIIELLKARGLIDLVGVQGHAFEFNHNNLPGSAATHRANLTRLQGAGLPVYVTEFDVDGNDNEWGLPDDAAQLERMRTLFPVFWEHEAVKGVTMWGYVQFSHWRTPQGAWLMYTNGAERPALQWLVRYMENELAVVAPGQSFTLEENIAGGTAIGTVVASDADADTTLSQWEVQDPSGKFGIDPATGTLVLLAGATLDFEMGTSYPVTVSVYDGYRRSAGEVVTIQVKNLNDNAPVIAAGQSFNIDDGYRGTIGPVEASDADDTNQPEFTTFSGWTITSGNTHNVFRLSTAGDLQIARPLLIDWRRTSYSLGTRVSDGVRNSAVQPVTVKIPNRVDMCLLNIRLEAPKATAPLILLLGGDLGACRRPR
jgi:endo-1,4-beta-xylanase